MADNEWEDVDEWEDISEKTITKTSVLDNPIYSAASKVETIRRDLTLPEKISRTATELQNAVNRGATFGIVNKPSKNLSPQVNLISELAGGAVLDAPINAGLGLIKSIGKKIRDIKKVEQAVSLVKKAITPKSTKIVSESTKIIEEQKIADGLSAIADNKGNLSFGDETARMPRNVEESVSAANQTKKKLLDEYTALRKSAGEEAYIDMRDVAAKVFKSQSDLASKIANPDIQEYAFKEAARLSEYGKVDLEVAEDIIRKYNAKLEPFYSKSIKGFDDVKKAQIDALTASAIRSEVDDAIMSSTGKSYQTIKNKYGAVAQLEKDFVKKLDKMSKKGKYISGEALDTVPILYGAFTGNAPLFLSGVAQKTIKSITNSFKEPDNLIKRAFNAIDKERSEGIIDKAINVKGKGIIASSTINKEKKEK